MRLHTSLPVIMRWRGQESREHEVGSPRTVNAAGKPRHDRPKQRHLPHTGPFRADLSIHVFQSSAIRSSRIEDCPEMMVLWKRR